MATLKKHESPFMKIGIVLLVILVVVIIRATWSVYQKSVQTEEKRIEAEKEMEALHVRKKFLEVETERLSTADGMDSEIRRQFGFADEGENVFIIIDPEPVATSTAPQLSFWDKIKSFFGGN